MSRRLRGRHAAGAALLALVATLLPATPSAAKPKPVRLTLSDPGGERTIDAADLRFVFFDTRYRRTRVPVEESPTRERLEIVHDREDCRCLRLADYTRIRFSILREIEVRTTPDGSVATVRVVRRDGQTHEYLGSRLYGGDGLAPPLLMATIDGVATEFPLVLPDAPGAAWPPTMLVRALLTAPPPPPKSPGKSR
ncbi:MAG TPA: hypothetical protein VJV75_08155 [Candidatus Polarisedimenticolia bacterium]|nr:hypothetical protein [Candidatus Polarisedimenticolia bacterium]